MNFQFSSQALLHGFGGELLKPTVAIFLDLEREARKGVNQFFVFTNAGNKKCKIFDGTTVFS